MDESQSKSNNQSRMNCFSARGRSLLTAPVSLIVAMALSVIFMTQPVIARERVIWAALDFPPFQIREGAYQGTGSFDGLLALLTGRLEEFDHEVMTMTFARRELEIREGHPLCTPGLFKTPAREALLEFSLPALIHLDNRLVFLSSRAGLFGDGSPIDLRAVLSDTKLVGGIFKGRSFAPNIDPLLVEFAQAQHLTFRAVRSSQMFELLIKGEIDYTIFFPHEVAYLSKLFPGSPDLTVVPIAGTPPYIFTHVACTKGDWSRAIIGRINEILSRQIDTADYREFSRRWYNSADQGIIETNYHNLVRAGGGTP